MKDPSTAKAKQQEVEARLAEAKAGPARPGELQRLAKQFAPKRNNQKHTNQER